MSSPSQTRPEAGESGAVDLDRLSEAERDGLDQGVVGLDSQGRIVSYSRGAAMLSGLSSEAVIGRHYFREVQPSTNVPAFHGRFLDGVRRGRLDERFEFVFGTKPRPLRARIGLSQAAEAGLWWLLITPLDSIGVGHSREAVMAAVERRARAEPVDPTLCEREPIHVPGSIQPNAAMIVADADSFAILAHSANLHDALPADGPSFEGRSLDAVLPAEFVAALREGVAAQSLLEGRFLRRLVTLPGRAEDGFHAVAHVHHGRVVVELELAPSQPQDFSSASPLDIEQALLRLRAAGSLADAAGVAVVEIRALTGFESVLVYRFDAEWNGEAIAEDMAPHWQRPLIGLHFPSSDIPAQARALYHKAKSRFVIDRDCVPVPLIAGKAVGNAPIDLTFAQNRTLSPIHLEYQRNLGVNGSMSVSILVDGRLWGLMIGHHRQPHYVAPESRAAATVLTDAFAMRVQEIEARRLFTEQQAHLDTEGRLVRSLTRSDDFVQALTSGPTTLLDLFGAGGAGVISGDGFRWIGTCPDEAQVLALAEWLKAILPAGRTSFESHALASVYAPAEHFKDKASGLLAVFVDGAREHLLLWFKPEISETVTWGGDPRKPVLPGSGQVAVLPRRSFERWVEERSGFSEPWADWQASLAEQLANAVEGVVLRQKRKIDELTGLLADKEQLLAQKDLLTKEIDHRVKNSLQIVSAFLQMQRRQVSDPGARQAFAETSARVMSVARVHDSLYQADSFEQVDLSQTIESLCNDLAGMAGEEHSVDLVADAGLMVPYRKAVALSLIATELVTNAFKYAGGQAGGTRVEVTVKSEGEGVRLRVCDDGAGLPPDWEKGKPKGTGLGMKLIRAMLDQIEARLEVQNAPGACFTVHA